MKILYHFRTRGTGPEAVHISGIATALEKLGHRVEFSSPMGIDPRKTAGANPYKGTGRSTVMALFARFCPAILFELLEIGYNVPAYLRNRGILKATRIDLIYERHALFLASTAWLTRQHGVPLVVEVNELVGDARVRRQPWLSSLARRLDKFLFSRAAVIVVVSPYLKRRLEALGIPADKILVLPNAVDADEYSRPASGGAMRKRFGLEGKTIIGFVGWFVPWHRLDLLLEAFAVLAATRPDLRLVLVGEGPLQASLQEQGKQLGIENLVLFPGAIPHNEIPLAIASMDVCIVPHSNEYRSPIKLFEYMGQGKLVVAPSIEPIEMVVRDGLNGLLFRPENQESMIEALRRSVDDVEFRNTAGTKAREEVLAHHTWRENASRVLEAVGRGKAPFFAAFHQH